MGLRFSQNPDTIRKNRRFPAEVWKGAVSVPSQEANRPVVLITGASRGIGRPPPGVSPGMAGRLP